MLVAFYLGRSIGLSLVNMYFGAGIKELAMEYILIRSIKETQTEIELLEFNENNLSYYVE